MGELQSQGEHGSFVSPGGFEFGVQGWNWAHPIPKSVTFFLDGTALVADQYGRPIRGLMLDTGETVLFAPCPPQHDPEGRVFPRPQYASHAKVIEALLVDLRIDLVAEMNAANDPCPACKGKMVTTNGSRCGKCRGSGKRLVIACAGWPQLPYEMLKAIKLVPPTSERDLQRILSPTLRKAALSVRREVDREAANSEEQEADQPTDVTT
jgi:hypothetical protein